MRLGRKWDAGEIRERLKLLNGPCDQDVGPWIYDTNKNTGSCQCYFLINITSQVKCSLLQMFQTTDVLNHFQLIIQCSIRLMKFECQSTVQKNNILEIKERVSMQTHMFQSEWAIWIIATTKPRKIIAIANCYRLI